MGLGDVAVEVGGEVLESTVLRTYQYIAVLEAECLGLAVELHAEVHVLHRDVGVAPIEQNHRVDEQCQQEVDQHATNHNQQALPGWLRAELPRLFGLFHLLGIEALVNHARYLAVAA